MRMHTAQVAAFTQACSAPNLTHRTCGGSWSERTIAPPGHGHICARTAVARDAVDTMAEGAGTQIRSAGPEGDPGKRSPTSGRLTAGRAIRLRTSMRWCHPRICQAPFMACLVAAGHSDGHSTRRHSAPQERTGWTTLLTGAARTARASTPWTIRCCLVIGCLGGTAERISGREATWQARREGRPTIREAGGAPDCRGP